MIRDEDIVTVERLIRLSDTRPLIPNDFIPWDTPQENHPFMPEESISLHGHPLYDQLNDVQKRELGRMEVAQVMWSYAWSEGLACLIFTRRLIKLHPTSLEYRYLIKELIEEFRHQDMFSRAVQLLRTEPLKQPVWAKILVWFHLRFMPLSALFISVLAVELVTDMYGKKIRRDSKVYLPLRKVSELHHIEEGRHIHYTKLWLKHFLEKAGPIKRSFYSFVVLFNIVFMRSLYVRKENIQKLNVADPAAWTRAAKKQLRLKFGSYCYEEAIPFVKSFRGFNWFTRPFWRIFLKVEI